MADPPLFNEKYKGVPKIAISSREEINQRLAQLLAWIPMTKEQIIFRAIDKYYEKHRQERERRLSVFRGRLLKRQGFVCFYCKKGLLYRDATIDHKVPVARGGPNEFKNLVAACTGCNSLKGYLTPEEYERYQTQKELEGVKEDPDDFDM